ncbi:MAG: hypothetical protein A2283_16585 [Lentisphaerae bacterium RIFOXYA12_FULL_48_11]|nr:MAG: hypothetical protein A2283_16585 [Lentisphaerae bacterium RIFOXYA12_FULL_48_11]
MTIYLTSSLITNANIDQAQTNYTAFSDFYSGCGQSFLSGQYGFLSGIEIVIKDNINPGSFEMNLWRTDAEGLPNGSSIATGRLMRTAITYPEPHWYFVKFDVPYQQVPGEQLIFTLELLTERTSGYNQYGYHVSSSPNAYTNGMWFPACNPTTTDWAFKTIIDPLYVEFSANKQTGLTPLDVIFSSSVMGTNLSNLYYSWDFNNDGIPDKIGLSLGSVTNTYTNAGVFSIALTVSNECGDVAYCLKHDLITAIQPALHADFIADKQYGITPLQVVFTSSIWGVADSNAFYSWDFDNKGIPDQSGLLLNMVTNVYSVPGSHSVSLVVSNIDGQTSVLKQAYIWAAPPPDIHVSLNGSNIPPYNSMTTAATNIQTALDAAIDGNTILVWPGTYSGIGNNQIDFHGKKIVLTSLAGRTNTIIDCQSNGPAFYFHSGETTNVVISGFTIQNCGWLIGGGSSYSVTNPASGIVCISNSSPRITDCLITDNRAFTGGGIYIESSNPQIENSIINANYARYGGGIYCANGSIVVSNCTISGGLPDYIINAPPRGNPRNRRGWYLLYIKFNRMHCGLYSIQ